MYRHYSQLIPLEDLADTKAERQPDPAIVGTQHEREYLNVRTIEELEAMEAGLSVLQGSGDMSELDPASVALMDGWLAGKAIVIERGDA
jgi:hypothetical protein